MLALGNDISTQVKDTPLQEQAKEWGDFFRDIDIELKKIEIESSGHQYKVLNCTHCGYRYVAIMNCGDRTCPICRKKWYGRHYRVLRKLFRHWIKKNCLYKLELTLKNFSNAELTKDKIRYLRQCFRALLRRQIDPGDNYKKELFRDRIEGGFYFVHVTNIGNDWHLHLHIIYKGQGIDHDKIRNAWKSITGDSYIVWICPVKSVSKAIKYLLGDLLQKPKIFDQYKGLYNEVFKRSKLVQGFGICYKVKFKKDFVCPRCGNSNWIIPELELNLFHKEIEQGLYDDTS